MLNTSDSTYKLAPCLTLHISAMEGGFDQKCYRINCFAIGPFLHVNGLQNIYQFKFFMSLDRTAFYLIMFFMALDWTAFYSIVFPRSLHGALFYRTMYSHVIGWYLLYRISVSLVPLDHTYLIGSPLYLI